MATKKAKKTTKSKTAAKTAKVTTKAAGPEVLNRFNLVLGFLLLIEAVAIVVLSRTLSVPVTTNYLSTDALASQAAGHTVWAPALKHLFDVNLAYAVAVCLAVAGVARLWVATRYRKTYETDLKQGINKSKRFEYIIGGGLVLLVLALVNGVYDVSTLLAIFGFTEILGLFSLIVERNKEVPVKQPRIAGKLMLVAAFAPWVILAIYLFGAQLYGDRSLPAYIYFLDASIFLLAVIMSSIPVMQMRGRGKFADYVYSEKAYLLLNFVLVSAFAWQIYFGALR
jgi:hypothetical protein